MQRPTLEVADIFRDFGSAWLEANRGHVSHAQLKVMSAIGVCRTVALGGYVARCENADCGHTLIFYCSNRHCPKCQGSQVNSPGHHFAISPQRSLAATVRPNHWYSHLSPGPALHRSAPAKSP